MKRLRVWVGVCLVAMGVGVVLPGAAQGKSLPASVGEVGTDGTSTVSKTSLPELQVPRLVRLSGALRDALGQPQRGVAGITFAIYQEQEGGAALWLETQNAELDEQGRYTVLLGLQSSEGLPLEIFSTTEARWLGVTVQGEPEQERILLVSVPYALKAADAERLGGQLAATFVSKDPETGQLLAGGEVLESSALASGGDGTSAQVVSGDEGFLAKFTGPDSVGNSVAFDSNGFIGLGTTTPGARLEALITSGGEVPFRLNSNFGGGNAIDFYPYIPGVSNDGFQLSVGGVGRLWVRSDGKVGIGTTTPGAQFESLVTSGGEVPFRLNSNFGGGNPIDFYPYIPGVSNDGFQLSLGGVGRLWVRSDGRVGIGTSAPEAMLQVAGGVQGVGLESFVTTTEVSPLRLNTNFGGGNAVDFYPYIPGVSNDGFQLSLGGVGRLWVRSNGNVGVGTASPSEKLHVDGNVLVSGDVTATSHTEISSRQWKENIQPLEEALKKVERLRGVSYDLKNGGKHDIGLIAEEVAEVIPEVVVQDENGRAKAVNYGRLTALLVEAVKEQQSQIQRLQAELEALRAERGTSPRGGRR